MAIQEHLNPFLIFADIMPETAGDRVYRIRRALGPDERTEMPLVEFVALLEATTGRKIDKSALSKMERGKQRMAIRDIEAIAKLDPKQRGPWWIAWGVEVSGKVEGDEGFDTGIDGTLPPAKPVPRPVPRPAVQQPLRPRKRGRG